MNSIYAGLDFMPLDLLAERGVVVTNGVGINAITIAEYVVMLMLAHAKGYREVVRAQDRHEWLLDSPGKRELAGERVLLLGRGAIGSLIKTRLEAFDMKVVPVRRSGAAGALTPGEWRGRLVYKKFAGRADILREYQAYQRALGRDWAMPAYGPVQT